MELYCHMYSNASLGKMNIIIWIAVMFAIYHYIISYFWIITEPEIDQYGITKLQSSIELVFRFYFWCDHRILNNWKLPDKNKWNA